MLKKITILTDHYYYESNRTEAVDTLIRGNAKTINTANAKDNEKSQKANWWINELDSLGMKKSKQEESNKGQEFEDLTDDIIIPVFYLQ